MAEKALASLSSGLLARKGQARPAMRSQLFGGFGNAPQSLDDLGWNDMGAPEPGEPAPVIQAAPPAATVDDGAPVPVVLIEREALKDKLTAPAAVKSVSVATATRIRRETAHAGKAAFTLRVEADRHLRLRLISAITNRSAQDLVTEALDALLQSVPEVDALVAQLPRVSATRSKR